MADQLHSADSALIHPSPSVVGHTPGEWQDHDGNGCPLTHDKVVDVRFADDTEVSGLNAGFWSGGNYDWWAGGAKHPDDNIVAYRVTVTATLPQGEGQ